MMSSRTSCYDWTSMGFEHAKNCKRNRYYMRIEDHDPPAMIVHIMKLHVESKKPVSNDDVRTYLRDVARASRAVGLHTDETNACEQAGLLARVSSGPTFRRVTDKGRHFYERHRDRLNP